MKIGTYRIGFIGFGHMAKIICQSIIRSKLIPRSQILFTRKNPHKIRQAEQEFGITSTTLETLVSQSDLLLLCVRPQQAQEVLKSLASCPLDKQWMISILAGVKISYFEKFLGGVPLLRAMPNIASEVGEGMTILTPSKGVGIELQSAAHLLFSSMGGIVDLPEEFMDLATAMAGSGTAFVLELIDAMARFGVQKGMDAKKSVQIAAQTFLGASRLLLQGNKTVQELLQGIALPQGTTEAGLRVYQQLGIATDFQSVIEAAALRSKEISKEFF